VTAEVYGLGRTPEQARREALQRARDKAVAEVTGIHIAAQQLRLKSVTGGRVDEAFSYLVQTSTRGRIVREQVVYGARLEHDIPVYSATLVAEVALEEGTPDPTFTLEFETEPESHAFRDGETIRLWVAASRDCYLTLLNLREDGTVSLLFPNRHAADNRLTAGEGRGLPASSHAFQIRAELGGARQVGAEQILAVATLDPVPFAPLSSRSDPSELAGESNSTLHALNRWLMQIPARRRAEAMWNYRVIE
jgi:hypothetical protein